MTNKNALPALSSEGSLSHYLQQIKKFPMLSEKQEVNLAKKWRDEGDTDAAHTLVTSHLRLVAKIAMGYRGYGLPVTELISEGNIGLMQAVKKYDPDKGFRLATYAMWWIKASIQEYVLRSWSLVKIGTTASQKKLFFNLRKLKGQMKAIDEGDLSPENVKEIASRLDVPEHEVVSMNARLSGPDHSLNSPRSAESDGEWQDWLIDESQDQEQVYADRQELNKRSKLLFSAMKALNPREQYIIKKRRLSENAATLEELGSEFGISRERVRQVEVKAFEKLQKNIKTQLSESNGETGPCRNYRAH